MTDTELHKLLFKVATLADADFDKSVASTPIRMARKCARTALDVLAGAPDPTAINWQNVGAAVQVVRGR